MAFSHGFLRPQALWRVDFDPEVDPEQSESPHSAVARRPRRIGPGGDWKDPKEGMDGKS